MLTFRKYLIERPQWQTSLISLVLGDNLMQMSNSPYNVVFPLKMAAKHFPQTVTTAHIASIRRVDEIVKLQNKKSKHLSTLTKFEKAEFLKGGLHGGGGTVYLLTGTPLVGGRRDIWSMPTKQGTRLITLWQLIGKQEQLLSSIAKDYYEALWSIVTKVLRRYEKDLAPYEFDYTYPGLNEVSDTLQRILEMLQDFEDEGGPNAKKVFGKVTNEILRGYMDFWDSYVKSNKDFMRSILFGERRDKSITATYNEVVLSNFEVNEVHTIIESIEDEEALADILDAYPNIPFIEHDSAESIAAAIRPKLTFE